MAKDKASFDALEKVQVSDVHRQASLDVLSLSVIKQFNVDLLSDLLETHQGKLPSYSWVLERYNKFLEETSGHPAYFERPWLAAYYLLSCEGTAERARGTQDKFKMCFKVEGSQTFSYMDAQGNKNKVRIPRKFQGYFDTYGKYKKMSCEKYTIKISSKEVESRMGVAAFGPYQGAIKEKQDRGGRASGKAIEISHEAQDASDIVFFRAATPAKKNKKTVEPKKLCESNVCDVWEPEGEEVRKRQERILEGLRISHPQYS